MLVAINPVSLEFGIAVIPVVTGEKLALVVLVAEGLNDPNTADIVFNARVELADTLEE